MSRLIQAPSGHTLHVELIEREAIPIKLHLSDNYNRFFVVRNFDEKGPLFFYLGKGHPLVEVVAWYPNGRMWSGCGHTMAAAIAGAQRDGWQYAQPDDVPAPEQLTGWIAALDIAIEDAPYLETLRRYLASLLPPVAPPPKVVEVTEKNGICPIG